MYRFLLGFAAGVYVGTWYDCKPMLEKVTKFIEDNSPKSK